MEFISVMSVFMSGAVTGFAGSIVVLLVYAKSKSGKELVKQGAEEILKDYED